MSRKAKTVTKQTLIRAVAEKIGVTQKSSQESIQCFLELMSQALTQGYRLEFRDFGILEPVIRKAKLGHNPQNNDPLVIPAHTTVKFTPGKKLLEQLEEAYKEDKDIKDNKDVKDARGRRD